MCSYAGRALNDCLHKNSVKRVVAESEIQKPPFLDGYLDDGLPKFTNRG